MRPIASDRDSMNAIIETLEERAITVASVQVTKPTLPENAIISYLNSIMAIN